MKVERILFLASTLALASAACGGDDTSGTDGGPSRDAGVGSDGGATMDGGASTDGGGGMDGTVPTDGGPPSWPDAGGLADPEWVDLTVGPAGSCPDWAACGGDVVGVWDVAGGCFEIDIESAISSCPGAMVTRREAQGRGRVVFRADGTAHRVAESVVESDVFIPAICTAVVSCDMIETAMAAYVTEATCTANAAGACDCTARLLTTIDDRDGYRIEGNEIVSATAGHRWEYCITGDELRYRDVTPTGPREPGTVELTRR